MSNYETPAISDVEKEELFGKERLEILKEVIIPKYFSGDDAAELGAIEDEEDLIFHIYGMLLELGEDPDLILYENYYFESTGEILPNQKEQDE